jgi:hypothetical protein
MSEKGFVELSGIIFDFDEFETLKSGPMVTCHLRVGNESRHLTVWPPEYREIGRGFSDGDRVEVVGRAESFGTMNTVTVLGMRLVP